MWLEFLIRTLDNKAYGTYCVRKLTSGYPE